MISCACAMLVSLVSGGVFDVGVGLFDVGVRLFDVGVGLFDVGVRLFDVGFVSEADVSIHSMGGGSSLCTCVCICVGRRGGGDTNLWV